MSVDLPTTLALAIGLYGAALSTFNFAAARRRDRPSVAVSCHFGYVRPRDDDERDAVPVITVEALNVGVRPVEIRRAGFIRNDGEHIQLAPYLVEPQDTPYVVTDGTSMRFHFRTDRHIPAERSFEVSQAFVDGGRGRTWRGEPDEWLRPVRVAKRWPHL